MKILIAGVGAMGATFGSMLKKNNHDVSFVDTWEDNIKYINEKGINFNNQNHLENISAKVFYPNQYNDRVDLIIVFVKSMQLYNMIKSLNHIIDDNTMVLCMLNGLGHIETLKKYFSEKQILMGVTTLTASTKSAGNFYCTSFGITEIQNLSALSYNKAISVIDILNNCGFNVKYSNNILYSIWKKACINGTMNSLCTILDCNMRTLGKVNGIKVVFRNIISEFSLIAKTQNVDLDIDEITELCYSFTSEDFVGSLHYPSMHQDLIQNSRKTEIDFLNGYVSKMGYLLNIETKYCDTISSIIHAKEQIICKED